MDRSNYKRPFFLGLILIALGVTFNTTLKDSIGSLGSVFIALGGFFFIVSIARKRKYGQNKEEENNG